MKSPPSIHPRRAKVLFRSTAFERMNKAFRYWKTQKILDGYRLPIVGISRNTFQVVELLAPPSCAASVRERHFWKARTLEPWVSGRVVTTPITFTAAIELYDALQRWMKEPSAKADVTAHHTAVKYVADVSILILETVERRNADCSHLAFEIFESDDSNVHDHERQMADAVSDDHYSSPE